MAPDDDALIREARTMMRHHSRDLWAATMARLVERLEGRDTQDLEVARHSVAVTVALQARLQPGPLFCEPHA